MRLGPDAMEALCREITGKLHPGEELVVVGAVALSGTAEAAAGKYQELRAFFSTGFLQDVCRVEQDYGVGEKPQESNVWRMAEASQVGLSADLRKIPIRQETIEICERYDLNPYRLKSGGAVLLGIAGGEALVQKMRRLGFQAEVIGQTNAGNDRLLYSGEKYRYLERPAEDEIKKLFLQTE